MRQIIGQFDNEGIYVYQAFKPSITEVAVSQGKFGKGFGMERMTWIKPSFGWVLYRSGYATKHRQETIVKVKISHEGFLAILREGIPTSYNPELFKDERTWQKALKNTEVRFQWDPDRDARINKLQRRAIQIGIKGEKVYKYVHEWCLSIENVTALAHKLKNCREKKIINSIWPEEKIYPLPPELQKQLEISK